METNGIPTWVQNKINKLEQKKLIVRQDVANNMQREIDQLKQKYSIQRNQRNYSIILANREQKLHDQNRG